MRSASQPLQLLTPLKKASEPYIFLLRVVPRRPLSSEVITDFMSNRM